MGRQKDKGAVGGGWAGTKVRGVRDVVLSLSLSTLEELLLELVHHTAGALGG